LNGLGIKIVIAFIGWIILDVQFIKGRGPEGPAIEELGGQIVPGLPDQGQARVERVAEIRIIIVAQPGDQFPIFGQPPFVLQGAVDNLPGIIGDIDVSVLVTSIRAPPCTNWLPSRMPGPKFLYSSAFSRRYL